MQTRITVFDLDNTLAESKQPIEPATADVLSRLLTAMPAAVISGGSFEQLAMQVVQQISSVVVLEQLYLMPTSGAALYHFDGSAWNTVYEELLTEEERTHIMQALKEGAAATGLIDFSKELYGPYIEDRGSQISLSALGQKAPVDEKKAWDPSHEKRTQLQKSIAPLLPGFEVAFGGMTTIDVTKRGINKAFGIRKLSAYLDIPISDMLYIGDELRPGGNDFVVTETGIPTKSVAGSTETRTAILALLDA